MNCSPLRRKLCGFIVLFLFLLSGYRVQAQATYLLPYGFVQETVVADLEMPTGFAFAPDGRIFIAEKAGIVRVVVDGVLAPEPFIDLRHQINTVGDRGLMGIAIHPAFPATPYVYLSYVYEPAEAAGRPPEGARVARVVRVEANPQNTNLARPETETVLLGANSTFAHIGNPDAMDKPPYTCYDAQMEPIRDCVPNEGPSHTIDALRFGPDGALYVASGDGINYGWGSLRAQDLDSLAGKILRIDPLSGQGYPNNPFYDGDPGSNRSKIFALGMRQPWRFGFHPESGELYAIDVGNWKWEEINRVPVGANLGWPCFEGPQPNAFDPECEPVLSGEWPVTHAFYAYEHDRARGAAIGGDFARSDNFPAGFQDKFFYAEFNEGSIEYLRPAADDTIETQVFAHNVLGPVQVSFGPDGALYVLSVIEGTLTRIHYQGDANAPPLAFASASPSSGDAPLTVQFSSKDTHDPNGETLQLTWDFGDGTSSSEHNPVHTYTEEGSYTAQLTATDPHGATATATVAILVGSSGPTVEILAPTGESRYGAGERIQFEGRAIDPEEGELPGERLEWEALLHHNDHEHYDFFTGTGTAGSFVYQDHGDNTYLELCLSATDATGIQGRACVDVRPQEVVYTINSVPPGLSITYDGSPFVTPFRVRTQAGAVRRIAAPPTAGDLHFAGWSDGGDATHEITIDSTDRVLTAQYADAEGNLVADETGTAGGQISNAEIVNAEIGNGGQSPAPDGAAPATGTGGRGQILREYWFEVGGQSVADLQEAAAYPDSPTGSELLPRLETARIMQPDYGSRIRGYIHPPVSGSYRFFIASDDNSELWLSSDESPANAVLIAHVPTWTGMQQWDRMPEQVSPAIELEAGRKYYIEVLHKQADGKDSLAVAWQVPGGEIEVIEGSALSPFQP